MQIEIPELTCLRCGHTWVPRGTRVYTCPSCRSYKWQEEVGEGERGRPRKERGEGE